jgi:hypothetical protein
MNEEGDGPSNRIKSLALHPTSYEAQRVFAMVLDRLNEPEYSMNEEGDGTMPPGTASSGSGEDSQDDEWLQPKRSSEDGPTSSDSSSTSNSGSGSDRGSDASERDRGSTEVTELLTGQCTTKTGLAASCSSLRSILI